MGHFLFCTDRLLQWIRMYGSRHGCYVHQHNGGDCAAQLTIRNWNSRM